MRILSVESSPRAVLAATLASGTVVAHIVAAKAARDALFLAGFRVALLPRMMVVGAVVSLAVAFISARVMQRVPPAKMLLSALGASAFGYAIEWALIDSAPRPVALMLYVHVSAFGPMLVAALWSLVNERFDPHTAKRQIARIALGGSFGGVLGGIAAWLVSGARGMPLLLVMLGVLNLATVGAVVLLTRSGRAAPLKTAPEPTDRSSPLRALRDSPYLATLAVLVALSSFSSALLDYVLSARLVAIHLDVVELSTFFALFHAAVGLLAMLVQLTLTRAALEWLGLGGSVALVPSTVLTLGVIALAVPHVWSAVLLRGAEALVQGSLSRSAYELFYTPLPRAQKRPTKMLIDVGVDRIGTMAGGAVTALMVATFPGLGKRTFVAIAMAVAIGSLFCAARLHGGYVAALAGRLRRGAIRIDPRDVFDSTTRRTLADSIALDRRALLDAIEQQTSQRGADRDGTEHAADGLESGDTVLVGPSGAGFEAAPGSVGLQLGSTRRFRGSEERRPRDPLIDSIIDLRSDDTDCVRRALAGPIEPEVVAHVVPLLGRDELARDALAALRSIADRATGALSDALLDPTLSVVIRRRVPRALDRCPTSRCAQALVEGLFDPEQDVRSQCALALLRIIEQNPKVPLSRERIVDAIQYDLSRQNKRLPASKDVFDGHRSIDEEFAHARADPRIDHAMTLLAVVLEREPVHLAYHALYGDDPALRGTAIEYLDNVLPEGIKPALLGLVEGSAPAMARRRDLTSLVEELLRARERLVPSPGRGP